MSKNSANKNGIVFPGVTAFKQWTPEDPTDVVSDKVVVTSALSRPLVLSPPSVGGDGSPAPFPKDSLAPPTPSGVLSYEDALAAVFAQAGSQEEEPLPVPPKPVVVPTRSCTPEEVVAFLSSLPRHLSQETRFERMEEELKKYPKSDPNDLVGDAAAQLVALRCELQQHNAEQGPLLRAMQGRIELLELELARLRAQLAEQETVGQERRQDLLTRVDEMTGVIVFFDSYQSYLVRRAENQTEVVPEFVDNETALRLLERREGS